MQRPAKPYTPVRFRLQPPSKLNTFLITGTAGFIGFHLAEALLKKNHLVVGVDNLNEYYSKSLKINRLNKLKLFKNFKFEKLDIKNINKLHRTFKDHRPDYVIHLAAQAGVRYSSINPDAYIDSNIIGFYNITKCIKEFPCRRFIFASSSSVYGASKHIPFEESDSVNQPLSLYAATKKSNEILAHAFAAETSQETVGLRFFTVYGEQGRPDMAYFKFTHSIFNEEPITLFNKGAMARDMTYIDDIIFGILQSISLDLKFLDIPFEIFNLGNNTPVSTLDLLDFIAGTLNKKPIIEHQSASSEVEITWANLTKSKKLLNYSPRIKFEEGMQRFISWYLNNDIL